jgi:hypothetical protein
MNSIIEKREYTCPQLECVKLDTDISLALESPPPGPEESFRSGLKAPEYFNCDPFKTNFT